MHIIEFHLFILRGKEFLKQVVLKYKTIGFEKFYIKTTYTEAAGNIMEIF